MCGGFSKKGACCPAQGLKDLFADFDEGDPIWLLLSGVGAWSTADWVAYDACTGVISVTNSDVGPTESIVTIDACCVCGVGPNDDPELVLTA
jgi:hypothetical protein